MKGVQTIEQVDVQPGDKRKGWDKIRLGVLKTIDQVDVQPGDGGKGWDKMIR